MKKNTNVFKLSGNLALGGGDDYMGTQNMGKVGSYGVSSSNALKKTSNYGQSYENNNQYDYSQKAGTSQNRKYSRNQQQNTSNSYKQGIDYEKSSAKKIDYNYQNALNKLETDQLYNNKVNYKDSYRESSTNKGSYKDVYSNNNNNANYQNNNNNANYQAKSSLNRDSTKGSYKNYEEDVYTNSKQSYGSKITQPQQQDYYNQPNRGSSKPPVNSKPSNSYNQPQKSSNYEQKSSSYEQKSSKYQQQPSKYEQQSSKYEQQSSKYEQQSYNDNYKDQPFNNVEKEEIKEYDPSTFRACRQGCGRKFNPDSISRHQKICKKVFQNKRPQFNVQQQRIVAQEQKKLMKQGQIIEKKIQLKKKTDQKKQQNIPKWKVESLSLRAILVANRRGGQMTQEEKKLVNQAQDSSMTKCKFCGRNFSEKAAERHIPFCQQQQKKNALKKKK